MFPELASSSLRFGSVWLKMNRLRKAGVRADLPLELLAERRRGHGGEQSGANNRPAAELLFEQRDPTMPKQSLQRSGEKLAESAEEIKLSTYGVEDSARLSSRPTAQSLPPSAPTPLGCAPASWLWRVVLERRRYCRDLSPSG